MTLISTTVPWLPSWPLVMKPSAFRPWIWLEWQRQSRTGHLPSLPWLIRQELPFFRPDYDPVQEASTEEALAYLDGSPAAARAAA